MEESVGPHVARGSRRNSTTGVGSEELFKNLKSDWQNLQGCLSTMPLRRGGADAPIKKMPRYLRSARRGRSYTLTDLRVYDLPRFALSKVALLFLTRAQRPLLAGGAE